MSTSTDTAIIGAGPYGLSLAAHLRGVGADFRIFGKPMISWKEGMPPGMLLKSHPWSSCLYDPQSSLTLERYCADQGLDYHPSVWALPLETFIAYGEAFQARFAPNVGVKQLTRLEASGDGFKATFDDGEVVSARRVVIAVGVHPFKHVPQALADLPPGAVSHSSDYGPLDALDGKKVAVIGSGSSATDLAALLHERGAAVTLVARSSELKFSPPRRERKSLLRRLAEPLKQLISPGSGIGGGWLLKICADAPDLIHALPESTRLDLVYNQLGPLGHSNMRERVVGKVDLRLGRSLDSAESVDGKVRLHLSAADGRREDIEVDHVVAGTGYHIDVNRLGFLDSALKSRIRTTDGAPALSIDYETSVPGLFFIGPASANSFGPVARFVFGAIHPSRRLARRFRPDRRRVGGPEVSKTAQPALNEAG